MPYTTFRRFSVQAGGTNSGVWGSGGVTGDDLNTGLAGPLDYMLAGLTTFSVSGATIALDFVAGGGGAVQNAMWRFTGAMLQNAVASPNAGNATTFLTGAYAWENLTTGAFTITVTTSVGSVVLPQGRRGIMFVDAVNGPRITGMVGSGTADPIPSGSKTIWYNASAPSGWTAVALNDYAIKIVTNGGGAVASGSVAYSTLFARTATDAHALTSAEMPAHTHQVSGYGNSGTGNTSTFFTTDSGTDLVTLTSTTAGSGDSHTHGLDMRVLTAAFVLASRD